MQYAQANIRKLYAISALESIVFYYAFDKIFMQARGINLTQIIIIGVIYGLTVIIAEVPSGTLSDRWSRKYTLLLGSVFLGLNTIIWAISHSFLLFIIGTIFGGLCSAFRSGTDTSLLYDSLKEIGREKHYSTYLGRKRAIGAIGFIIAATLGGWIGQQYGIAMTFWLTLPVVIATLLVTLSLYEPKFHKSTGDIKYWHHITTTYRTLIKHPSLFHLVIILIAIMIPKLLLDKYGQLYFVYVGVGIFGLGIIAAVTGIIDTILNSIAHTFTTIRHDILFGASFLVMAIGYISSDIFHNMIGIALLLFGSAAFYIVAVIAETDFQHNVQSSIRATSESFLSVGTNIIYIPIALAFAWIGQQYTIAIAFTGLGFLILAYLAAYWLFSAKNIHAMTR
jgi:MFS family permease